MVRKRPAGFELRFVDWLMCRSHSEVSGALVGGLSGIALLLTVGHTFAHFTVASSWPSIGDIGFVRYYLLLSLRPSQLGRGGPYAPGSDYGDAVEHPASGLHMIAA
jgi:hypothetical protein